MRASDSAFALSITSSLLFLFFFLDFIDLPNVNPINQLTKVTLGLALFTGLVSGLFATWWYTKEQLKILAIKNEFKGYGSRKINLLVLAWVPIFLLISVLIIYFQSNITFNYYNYYFYFVFSALLTSSITRWRMIISWEIQEGKVVIYETTKFFGLPKFYVLPPPPRF